MNYIRYIAIACSLLAESEFFSILEGGGFRNVT